jgi:PST family polysaccharide transporter
MCNTPAGTQPPWSGARIAGLWAERGLAAGTRRSDTQVSRHRLRESDKTPTDIEPPCQTRPSLPLQVRAYPCGTAESTMRASAWHGLTMPETSTGSRRSRQRSLLRRALVLDSSDLGGRVVRGAGYQILTMVLRTVITIGSTAVLARLLMPRDFGYIAMATVVTELAALFSSFGLVNVLVQRRRMTRLQVDTVFWTMLALGCGLAASVFSLSFLAYRFFDEPVVGQLLRLMCLMFVLGALPTVTNVVLLRLMRFRVEFAIQVSASVARTGVAILFAYLGHGVWSLVYGALAGALAQAVLGFVAVPYMPRWRFDGRFLRATWRTSGSYFGGGLLFYANMNMDLMLIGRYLGATPLGYYQNARSLTDEIRARIATPLQHVLFPAFASIQHDRARLGALVMRSARLIASVVVPVGFIVAATAEDLVPVLYGSQWLPMVPVLSALGIGVAIKASTAISGPILNSLDRVHLSFLHGAIGTALTFVGIALTIDRGIETVAWVVACASAYWLVAYRIALREAGVGIIGVAQTLGPVFVAAAAAGAAILLLRSAVAEVSAVHFLRLLMKASMGLLVYLTVLLLLSRATMRDLAAVADRVRSARRSATT